MIGEFSDMNIQVLLEKMDLHQIEQLKLAKQAITLLEGRRKSLLAQMAEIDDQIAAIKSGKLDPKQVLPSAPQPKEPGSQPRARRSVGGGLNEHIVEVLTAAKEPLSVMEIADAVKQRGYESKSKDFVKVVRVAVYGMDNVESAERGRYRLRA